MSPIPFKHLTGHERDVALVKALGILAEEKPSLKPFAMKLIADAKANRKAGWTEDAEELIERGYPTTNPPRAA